MKVIFLDIDGPMIPASMFLVDSMASWKRVFPAVTVAVLNKLCERTEAFVVFNTTHNMPFPDTPNIDVALMNAGLKEEYLHPTDRHTKYPDIARDVAVKEWLHRHPEVTDWCALDDAEFTDDRRLVWVDPDTGISVSHLNQAIEILGGQPVVVLI